MRTTTDHFFTMGSTHSVCQDYARSGPGNQAAAAVVADGCSSSPDTDVGARILALEAMPWVGLGNSIGDVDVIVHLCEHAIRILPTFLKKECLDATLLTAQVSERMIRVVVWGDGFFVARRADNGKMEVHRISFVGKDEEPSGHPVYPSYFALDKGTYYIKEPLSGRLERVLEHSPVRLVEKWLLGPEGIEDHSSHTENVRSAQASTWESPIDYYDLIVLMSDGAESFYQSLVGETWRRNEPVEPLDVIRPMVDFKGMKGTFVQRRARRVLRDFEARNITHADDFSMAAIYIDHERSEP